MPKTKLTPNNVREIYTKYASGKYTEFELSQSYGVKPDTVIDIVSGRSWKRLGLPPMEELRKEKELEAWGYWNLIFEGKSYFDIAMINDTTPHEVKQTLEDYGTFQEED